MTYSDMIEITKNIDLEKYGISLGKPANKTESISCFRDGDDWVMQEVDDRQHMMEKRGNEEDIVRKAYGNIMLRIKQLKP